MQKVCLLRSTILLCLLTAPAWGQTYNPTASDPITLNTAGGTGAVLSGRGRENTAFGSQALNSITAGGELNTAVGVGAIGANETGDLNTATGWQALPRNTTGGANTATGAVALYDNTTGAYNTATGFNTLTSNTTGIRNTATGVYALHHNLTGNDNTALGDSALLCNVQGSRNTAIGWGAGANLSSGNDNIYLGAPGSTTESKTLRLGTSAIQTRAFIAGVAGRPVSGSQVMINSAGQLGVLASSERYKQHIMDMQRSSEDIYKLRPVTFHYKNDPYQTLQYGLIAEEVAKVYPELVIRNDDGRIEGVRYEELTPLLLNEVQRQQQELAELRARLDRIEMAGRRVSR